jgi:hypothetical protein
MDGETPRLSRDPGAVKGPKVPKSPHALVQPVSHTWKDLNDLNDLRLLILTLSSMPLTDTGLRDYSQTLAGRMNVLQVLVRTYSKGPELVPTVCFSLGIARSGSR